MWCASTGSGYKYYHLQRGPATPAALSRCMNNLMARSEYITRDVIWILVRLQQKLQKPERWPIRAQRVAVGKSSLPNQQKTIPGDSGYTTRIIRGVTNSLN